MADEVINVTIRPDGTVEMAVEGVEGMACLGDTQDLVTLLGGEVVSQELTGDAYVGVETDEQVYRWR